MYKRIWNIKNRDAIRKLKKLYKYNEFSKENGHALPLSNEELNKNFTEPFGKYTGECCEDESSKEVEQIRHSYIWSTFNEIFGDEE